MLWFPETCALQRSPGDPHGHPVTVSTLSRGVGEWYWIGLTVGLGTGCGVFASGILGRVRGGLLAAAAVGAGVGVLAGFLIEDWDEALGGGLGGIAGALGAVGIVAGALRRGGTRGGTAAIVGVAGVVVAALGLIPGVGYLEAVALPLLSLRLRARSGSRYAGLRILARD
jgi:hypothetical protein